MAKWDFETGAVIFGLNVQQMDPWRFEVSKRFCFVDLSMYGYQAVRRKKDMPHNSGVLYLGNIFVDPTWMETPTKKPHWSWLNHSNTPNAKLRIVGNREMRCIALGRIPKHAEIFFDYVEPAEDWERPWDGRLRKRVKPNM